jgi:pantothenate kinase
MQGKLRIVLSSLVDTSIYSDPKITSLASRLVESVHRHDRTRHEAEELDEDAIFAELEAEIENNSDAAMREQGLEVFKRE